jgi:hypothetical protein
MNYFPDYIKLPCFLREQIYYRKYVRYEITGWAWAFQCFRLDFRLLEIDMLEAFRGF